MRVGVPLGSIVGILLAFAFAAPTSARASSCDEATDSGCGKPRCWVNTVKLRPDRTRAVRVGCHNAKDAKVKTAPAHSDISNMRVVQWDGVHFDARPRDGAPRDDSMVLEIAGPEQTIELTVPIEVIPLDENSAPQCDGGSYTQRSDGTGPVEISMWPYCRDSEGDAFTIEGGGPGTHPYSPKTVPAGQSGAGWLYRTATFSGTETTTIWGTDEFGARGSDATLEVAVGPGVDRLPYCAATSSWGHDVTPIRMRPGAVRNFGIYCQDLDADPMDIRLSTPPERGAMPLFLPEEGFGYPVTHRRVDVTYAPRDNSVEPDPFTVSVGGPRGEGQPSRMAMTPVPLPENDGGWCTSYSGGIMSGTPGTLTISCEDAEGDPLSAKVVREGRHGLTGPAVTTPARYGYQDITIPYVAEPGYDGYDCVEVVVTDGHGSEYKLAIDVWVSPKWEPPPPPLPVLPPPPALPPLPVGTDLSPQEALSMARQILGTRHVKRVHADAGAQVWARSKLSRKELMRNGHSPGLVVLCARKCKIRGDAALTNGTRALRSSRRTTAAAVAARQPHVMSLVLRPAERKALGRAKRPQAKFNLSIRADGGKRAALKRAIAIGK
jgi:hypothetical protein